MFVAKSESKSQFFNHFSTLETTACKQPSSNGDVSFAKLTNLTKG